MRTKTELTKKQLYNQNQYVFWDRKELKWKIKTTKEMIKQKMYLKCPFCNSYKFIDFSIFFDYDLKLFNLVEWRCRRCARLINFNQFSEKAQDYLKNKVIPELREIYFNPVQMKIKRRNVKEKKNFMERYYYFLTIPLPIFWTFVLIFFIMQQILLSIFIEIFFLIYTLSIYIIYRKKFKKYKEFLKKKWSGS
jgi:hypothetical protein